MTQAKRYDRDHLPPGVLLIEEGSMRLLGEDERKEAFTLKRFNSGEIVGGELLLRGVNGLMLAAATRLKVTTASRAFLSNPRKQTGKSKSVLLFEPLGAMGGHN